MELSRRTRCIGVRCRDCYVFELRVCYDAFRAETVTVVLASERLAESMYRLSTSENLCPAEEVAIKCTVWPAGNIPPPFPAKRETVI